MFWDLLEIWIPLMFMRFFKYLLLLLSRNQGCIKGIEKLSSQYLIHEIFVKRIWCADERNGHIPGLCEFCWPSSLFATLRAIFLKISGVVASILQILQIPKGIIHHSACPVDSTSTPTSRHLHQHLSLLCLKFLISTIWKALSLSQAWPLSLSLSRQPAGLLLSFLPPEALAATESALVGLLQKDGEGGR